MQENAKLRFEMEQKAQALEQKDQELSDEIANLKKEIEKLTVKTKSVKKVKKPAVVSGTPAKATSRKPVFQIPKPSGLPAGKPLIHKQTTK